MGISMFLIMFKEWDEYFSKLVHQMLIYFTIVGPIMMCMLLIAVHWTSEELQVKQ